MAFQSPYVYFLEIQGQPPAPFTWPNVCRKYIKDVYTSVDGELRLPPEGHLILTRYKLNPKPGQAVIIDRLKIDKFMADGR